MNWFPVVRMGSGEVVGFQSSMEIRLLPKLRISHYIIWTNSAQRGGVGLLAIRSPTYGSRRRNDKAVRALPQSGSPGIPRGSPGPALKLIPSTALTALALM